ncbi:MAG: cysteine desulfurase [Bacteroidales bacterium]|jgi:cysteine desulfurase|nr:cysteine desulfurase [Bacteroidales bacterium]
MSERELYLDYVASTPLCRESRDAMLYVMDYVYANPSATHLFGRRSNVLIEQERRNIAALLHCSAHNLVFTSGATETINAGIRSICRTYKPQVILTSKLEHPATLRTVENLSSSVPIIYIRHTDKGDIDLSDLDAQLRSYPSSLLCLMHANNEIGTVLPLQEVGLLCKKHRSLFFCDMVQSIGKYDLNLGELPVDFAVGSAHKFYGPKASGLLYFSRKTAPLLYGGSQERNMRAGTENVYGICGMGKALTCNMDNLQRIQSHIGGIKSCCVDQLMMNFDRICFVGNCRNEGLYNLLNFYFPDTDMDIVRMELDIAGIAVSTASSCSSGSDRQSHVLSALGIESKSLRVSFGTDTSTDDIDYFIRTLSEIKRKMK